MDVRESFKWMLKIWALRLRAYASVLVGLVGFGIIGYGIWSAYSTQQSAGGAVVLNSSEYLPELVAWDMITIGVGAAIVLFASR
jgi:hypothetical protein